LRIVGKGGTVGRERLLGAHTFESSPHAWWHAHQRIVIVSKKQFRHFSVRGRFVPLIVECQPNGPCNRGIIERHPVMNMPTIDHSRINCEQIDLAKLFEMRCVGAQHMHYSSAFIVYFAQRSDQKIVDHMPEPFVLRKVASSRSLSRQITQLL